MNHGQISYKGIIRDSNRTLIERLLGHTKKEC